MGLGCDIDVAAPPLRRRNVRLISGHSKARILVSALPPIADTLRVGKDVG